MRLKNSKRQEEDKLVAVIVSPQVLPQAQNILEGELSFECNEDPAIEGQVGR